MQTNTNCGKVLGTVLLVHGMHCTGKHLETLIDRANRLNWHTSVVLYLSLLVLSLDLADLNAVDLKGSKATRHHLP